MTTRILSLVGLFASLPHVAQAQVSDLFCDDTTRIQQQLRTVIGAEQRGQGLRDPEAMIEIWIVPSSGDWTMVQSYANGRSCIIAIGEHWQALLPEPA